MKFFLASLFLLPLYVVAGIILYDEFQTEVLGLYSGIVLKERSKKVIAQIELELPGIVELFAILVSGGMSPSTALMRLSERADGEFAKFLKECVNEMKHGANLSQALSQLVTLVESPTVRRFSDSISIAIERGTPLTDVITRQVDEVRQKQRNQLLEAAGKAEIALMIPVVFLILPVSVLFALWPSYFALGQSMGM